MLNKEIPFRPKLEGNFRTRFYDVTSNINEQTSPIEIEAIVSKEIQWVEDECTYNLDQRKKYRAVWMLFRDLVRASWKACYRNGVLYMSMPTINDVDTHTASSPELKKLMRSWMSESRQESLSTHSDFVQRIEKKNSRNHSIDELIADGEELAARLKKIKNKEIDASDAIKPYLQLVVENERDEFTGIKTSEIWRYFRLTWSTPYETTPGRTMQYLIRDAAHPMHAVMGIISLENCPVQITCRDNFIGWNQTAYINKLYSMSNSQVRNEFEKLLEYLEVGISGIDYKDLCSEEAVRNPKEKDIQQLFDLASNAEQKRQELLKKSSEVGIDAEEKSTLGNITKETEDTLYKKKRAEQLAKLLQAKNAILGILESPDFENLWPEFCKSDIGVSSIRSALVAQKTQHIGSSLMELNVCGAIPPYNEILGGKLAALLALSPQVIHDYKERYLSKASMIASRLKGEDVVRPADLVYVETTSLYSVGSSQYNRLKIPGSLFGSDFDVKWEKLGNTIGYGTMHISKATTQSLTEATSDGYNRINHVFGEGSSPKLRLLNMSIPELLETTSEESKEFSKHAMSRIVYGACLVKNTINYLMGKDDKPEYYTDINNYAEGTQKIIDYWISRWLMSRLNYEPIYQRIKEFDKNQFLVGTQIKENEGWTFKKLQEVPNMPANDKDKAGLQFVRDFYHGSSAYADYIDEKYLSEIHLKSKLDDAILDAVKNGKDVVLTGNPGDGKTHIIRILKNQLENINENISIELDASTLSSEEIYNEWSDARQNNRPFVIAINAAVLYSVYKSHSDFPPIKEAYYQMINAVVFHDVEQDDASLVVYDLSKRDILTKEIIVEAINKLTAEEHYTECEQCPMFDSCVVTKNRKLLKNDLFQTRLCIILQRVSLKGYHATIRELQGFISYLIFGNRSCKELNQTAENDQYDIVNLIYSGKGDLFKAINDSIDPANISHPVWDEKILSNDIDPQSWSRGYNVPAETIDYNNENLFRLRKRQFFFFNIHGEDLLAVLDDDTTRFCEFLNQGDKQIIKSLIVKLNSFFGTNNTSNTKLQIWIGHRFDNEPRKVLISTGDMKKAEFSIGRPHLRASMSEGIDMTANYIRFEKKSSPNIFLKVDFEMYQLLEEAERGVPVLFMETDVVKKIWRFMEQLKSYDDTLDDDTADIVLLDVQNKRLTTVSIDKDEEKYISIDNERVKEG